MLPLSSVKSGGRRCPTAYAGVWAGTAEMCNGFLASVRAVTHMSVGMAIKDAVIPMTKEGVLQPMCALCIAGPRGERVVWSEVGGA